MVGGSAG
jgi:hypothetical protein